MKKLAFLFIFPLLFACSGDSDTQDIDPNPQEENPQEENPSEDCFNYEDVTVTTQAELDAFAAQHSCYVRSLTIGPLQGSSDITSVDELYALVRIGGQLTVQNNPLLSTFAGMHNIEKIDGGVYITNNDALQNLAGLTSVQYAGLEGKNVIHVYNNDGLEDLYGMFSLHSLEILEAYDNSFTSLAGLENTAIDMMFFHGNLALASLNGLQHQTAMKTIILAESPLLTSLSPLSNLQTLGNLQVSNTGIVNLHGLEQLTKLEMLSLYSNTALTSLQGVENITETTSGIIIYSNPALTSINHLSALTKIKQVEGNPSAAELRIRECHALQSLDGLQNLTQFTGNLNIFKNNSLKDFCAITPLLNGGVFANPPTINQNFYNPGVNAIKNGNCSPD